MWYSFFTKVIPTGIMKVMMEPSIVPSIQPANWAASSDLQMAYPNVYPPISHAMIEFANIDGSAPTRPYKGLIAGDKSLANIGANSIIPTIGMTKGPNA